ncbi:hypothetical protein AVEN_243053-1 [Araneus ventricosus]|uniref:Uncharacterized protein n=1 Tax=Araneus ventricosus TaxID=182803 RepID=A0A4Y2UYR4_ARAVE|nr:hypothetical protein AVEN_243053-1 [Araneus ventricosus]
MPDSYICQKYSGNSLNVESLKNGGLASKVRGKPWPPQEAGSLRVVVSSFLSHFISSAYSDETMLHRMSENGLRYDKQVQVNGNELNGGCGEPEWISLSRKLRAKFVEGHIGGCLRADLVILTRGQMTYWAAPHLLNLLTTPRKVSSTLTMTQSSSSSFDRRQQLRDHHNLHIKLMWRRPNVEEFCLYQCRICS